MGLWAPTWGTAIGAGPFLAPGPPIPGMPPIPGGRLAPPDGPKRLPPCWCVGMGGLGERCCGDGLRRCHCRSSTELVASSLYPASL